MPLIKCPACQNEVSQQAAQCPKCGHPIQERAGTLASPERQPRVTFHIIQLVLGLVAAGIILAVPVVRDQFSGREEFTWFQLFRSKPHYYQGWNEWQMQFTTRYESAAKQEMPKMMAAAMPIVILTWVLVAALGIPNNPRLVAFRIRGRKHILYWCAIPTVLAFVVLAHFNGESQAVLRGVFRWSTAGCFTTGWRILSLTVIASLIAHIVFLFRGFAEANPKELERR